MASREQLLKENAQLRAELTHIRSQSQTNGGSTTATADGDPFVNNKLVQQMLKENTRLKMENNQLRVQGERTSNADRSEGRLRAAMNDPKCSAEDLRQAIGAVQALLDEARRELGTKELRDRRAAYEALHLATEKGDEASLTKALETARRVGVGDEEIERGAAKLKELQSLTEEQRQSKASKAKESKDKKEAFVLIKKNDGPGLTKLLENLGPNVCWKDWRDVNGRTLWRYANTLQAKEVQAVLAAQLGTTAARGDAPSPRSRPRFAMDLASGSGAASPTVTEPASGENSVAASPSPPVSDRDEAGPAERKDGKVLRTRTEKPSAASPVDPNDTESIILRRNRTAPGVIGRGPRITSLLDLNPDESEASRLSPSASPSRSPRSSFVSPTLSSMADTFEDKLKARAFRAVGQDDGAALAEVLEQTTIEVVASWQNRAGTTLLNLSEERKSAEAYSVLAKAFGMVREIRRDEFEERDTVWVFVPGDVMPKRATVLEDTPAEADTILLEYWDGDAPAEHVERSRVRKMAS